MEYSEELEKKDLESMYELHSVVKKNNMVIDTVDMLNKAIR